MNILKSNLKEETKKELVIEMITDMLQNEGFILCQAIDNLSNYYKINQSTIKQYLKHSMFDGNNPIIAYMPQPDRNGNHWVSASLFTQTHHNTINYLVTELMKLGNNMIDSMKAVIDYFKVENVETDFSAALKYGLNQSKFKKIYQTELKNYGAYINKHTDERILKNLK